MISNGVLCTAWHSHVIVHLNDSLRLRGEVPPVDIPMPHWVGPDVRRLLFIAMPIIEVLGTSDATSARVVARSLALSSIALTINKA